jgi:HlyD family secretion protein
MAVTTSKAANGRLLINLGLFILGVAAGGVAFYFFIQSKNERPTSRVARELKAPTKVTALGRIEPDGGVITIGLPVPDRIRSICAGIKEEAMVKPGQELAVLESHALREIELHLIEQQLTEARAKLVSMTKKGQAKIEADKLRIKQFEVTAPLDEKLQNHQIELLEKQLANARENVKRIEGSPISQQEMDLQRLKVSQAEAELAGARDTLAKTIVTRDLEIKAARAQLTAAQAALASARDEIPISSLESQKKLAEVKLREAIVRAPQHGKILKILARPGELVGGQQALLQMADTEHMIVIAEVYETDIHKVRVGAKAIITGRALSEALTGKVEQIGAIVGRNRVFDVDPTADVDRRVIEVKIRLDQSGPASSLINHQVKVEIEMKSA